MFPAYFFSHGFVYLIFIDIGSMVKLEWVYILFRANVFMMERWKKTFGFKFRQQVWFRSVISSLCILQEQVAENFISYLKEGTQFQQVSHAWRTPICICWAVICRSHKHRGKRQKGQMLNTHIGTHTSISITSSFCFNFSDFLIFRGSQNFIAKRELRDHQVQNSHRWGQWNFEYCVL